MSDVLLQILWVAAHHGLRRRVEMVLGSSHGGDAYQPRRAILERQWSFMHDITHALGHPPAPGGPR